MNYGFIRVSSITPDLKVANCKYNADKIIQSIKEAHNNGSSLVVFPEFSITSYTCGDLFLQKSLKDSALEELKRITTETKDLNIVSVVGLPLEIEEALYNVGAILYKGKVIAFIPKTFMPNYSEFYERRYFTPYNPNLAKSVYIEAFDQEIPFGTDIIVCSKHNPGFKLALELCEDVWVPLPPSTSHALNGATIIANLSASNEIIGKASYRKTLIKAQSAHTVSAYIYTNCGHDESTQDVVFSGQSLICENGTILNEAEPFSSSKMITSDIDTERLLQDRRKTTSFAQCSSLYRTEYRKIYIDLEQKELYKNSNLLRYTDPHPFVPSNKEERDERAREVITLQAEGLAKRLRHINCHCAVIGLSGGLDSTLALLITCKAFDLCGYDRKGIKSVTMPCFGTTDRTYNNACTLAKECGTELIEVRIADSVRQHFKDIGQDESVHDVTYENCQARERTQVLMDIANKNGGIVIGTGDLSELALGWCTYNGDHMSMYGVNTSIPKTLVKYLVGFFRDTEKSLNTCLTDIIDTPVSPELLPPDKDGKIAQKTEDLVGPYELHDFYLYYLLRFGFKPEKILFLAEEAKLPYDRDFMLKWLKTFYRRFFQQQFKRSCMPDGAKVGSVNLSPRGDWRMPSDADASIWLKEIEDLS